MTLKADAEDLAQQPGNLGPPAETDAIERLFREHNESLVRFLVARLKSHEAALEVAQEAYVRLLSLDRVGAISFLRAFLFRTAANLAVDRLRRDQVHARTTEMPMFREFADLRTPERNAASAQELEQLQHLVAQLPARCREVFYLSRIHDLSSAEIASRLSISERMVRLYIVRALLFCRTHLAADPASPAESDDGE